VSKNDFKKPLMYAFIIQIIMFFIIIPLINYFGSIVNSYSNRYVDHIYKYASAGQDQKYSLMCLFAIFCLSTLPFVLVILSYRIDTNEDKIKNNQFSKILKYSENIHTLEIVTFLILISGAIIFSITIYDVKLNSHFQRNLNILSPKSSDMEIKELRASWASMKSKNDYVKIMKVMKQKAEQNKIELILD